MVIYIRNKKGIETIRIQEINEEKGDLRIGVYNEIEGKLIKIFSEKTDLKEIIKFAEEYHLKVFGEFI